MKTAVSIDDDIFQKADSSANRMGVSRSRLYNLALKEYLKAQDQALMTAAMNAVYPKNDSRLDSELREVTRRTLESSEW